MIAGCVIGYLSFRFSIRGVYFALLTIAFAEFTGIVFDNIAWLGGTEGFFLPVSQPPYASTSSTCAAAQAMFYYVILALTGAALVLCRLLLNSKLGLYWQAIREDQEAAEASGVDLFRYKMIAVAISSGMTGVAGVWYAFYYNNLFPDSTFATGKSIELILGTIVGGVGTLFGPIVGAFILTPLGEVLTGTDRRLEDRRHQAVLLGSLRRRHRAVPPGRHLAVDQRPARPRPPPRRQAVSCRRASLSVEGITKRFRGLAAVDNVSFEVAPGAIQALIGPNGAGKTTIFNMIAGVYRPDAGDIRLDGQSLVGTPPGRICHAGVGRTFQIVRPFHALTVEDNVAVGALSWTDDLAEARDHAAGVLQLLGLEDKRFALPNSITLPDRKRLEVARALATKPKLLLLDEVMAGLRPTETDRMVAVFQKLNAETGLTILLIEHVMRAVMALSRHIVVVNYGKVIAEGTPEEVTRNPDVLACYLGEEAL